MRRPGPVAPKVSEKRLQGPPRDETRRLRLAQRILAHLPQGRLSIAITDNRYTMISVKRDKGPTYRIRCHHMFLDAPPPVTRALARYIALNDKQASRELSRFIEANQTRIRKGRAKSCRAPVIRTAGDVYDLQKIFDDLNARYFENAIAARITWGPRGRRGQRRNSIKMGSYSVEDRLIRIHPSLDREFVPRYFLEWIVYHEMLHQVHPIPVVKGRRRFHTPAFLEEERAFEHYARARAWERQNLDRLLSY